MFVDAIVVGAGVVGLAIARALAQTGRDVIVIERESAPAQHASSRNSEVVHAGLYDPATSLKHRLCRRGRELLFPYCEARGVPLTSCGKFVVATDEAQCVTLQEIQARADANGVPVSWCDGDFVGERVPQIRCVAALWSPGTAIVDSHALIRSLTAEAEGLGVGIAYATAFVRAQPVAAGLRVQAGDATLTCATLVNAAGLDAHGVARAIAGLDPACLPPMFWAKGTYFAVRRSPPFPHLIYPVPAGAGLGIHVTVDLCGAVRLGPDVQWVDHLDYDVDVGRAETFLTAARTYWPTLDARALAPAYAGIRARVVGPGQGRGDFVIQTSRAHGVPGLVQLFGIESPGLTACLALAEATIAAVEAC